MSLSGQGPPHRREQDHSGSRQLRQHSSLTLLLRCYSQTALTDRPLPASSCCRSASPREPVWFWKLPRAADHRWCDTTGPRAGEGTSGQASPGALRCAKAGVPFALVLRSWRHVEHCPGPRVRVSTRQRPASPLRPTSRSSGLRAATRGTYLAGWTQWPPAPLALGSTRGGSTASPSARGGGCVCGGGEGRGCCLAGCGTNLTPFPPPPAARSQASVAVRKGW